MVCYLIIPLATKPHIKMQSDNYFDILSIDGGGIKGMYSAKLLELLESQYGFKSYECFNLICGTSTGGLIALALAHGNPAKTISNFYENNGKTIFPDISPRIRKIKSWMSYCFQSKYPNKKLKQLLIEYFGENSVMDDLIVPVNIPSYSLENGQQVIFKKSFNDKMFTDEDVPLVDVALATSAAPTYFPIHEIKNTKHRNGHYIDGGVWANDPSVTGLLEALKYLNVEEKRIRILSIATVPTSPKTDVTKHKVLSKIKDYKRRSLFGFGSKIFDYGIQAQQFQSSLILEWLEKPLGIKYLRIAPDTRPSEFPNLIEMDFVNDASIKIYKSMAQKSLTTYHSSNGEFLKSIFSPKT